ncbi:hypothetical protein ZWY2020_028114 [Hordeum vulgare]|nr:hypothetical protein ZWY2020_028114 [Hordeum vulgare]
MMTAGQPKMRACAAAVVGLVALLAVTVRAEDPYLFFEWKVAYGTKSPMGVPQKMILINGEFPGPTINCTSNNNIIVNVFNEIDKPLLFTCYAFLPSCYPCIDSFVPLQAKYE